MSLNVQPTYLVAVTILLGLLFFSLRPWVPGLASESLICYSNLFNRNEEMNK